MSAIESAIKEAVEKGGYNPFATRSFPGRGGMFLDPSFWQALGKARGWLDVAKRKDRHICQQCCEWLMYWHRFIDHLAEGKDAESFFADLLLPHPPRV